MKTSSKLTDARRSSLSEGAKSDKAVDAEALVRVESVPAAERHRRISERAYLRAAARSFVGDRQVEDWLAAEQEIDAETASRGPRPAPQPGVDANPSITHEPAKVRRA
jgi:Protein of unknown function (DUF2934)